MSARNEAVNCDPAEVMAQVKRVQGSQYFVHSHRYSSLLQYIVEHSLRGEQEELRERIIGMEVFGRPADYDTSIDPTVRVTAGEVRKRLALYYQGAERAQELRIEIPLRSYKAEFSMPASEEIPAAVAEEKPTPGASRSLPKWSWAAMAAVLLLLILGGAAWGYRQSQATTPIERFWKPFENPGGQTMIYVGTSSASDDISRGAESGVSTPESTEKLPYFQFSRQRGNVSMTDVTVAQDINFFLQSRKTQGYIREASGITLAELHNHPIILIGIENKWTKRLVSGLRYSFQRDSDHGTRWIEDREHPENRQWHLEMGAPYEQVDKDYAAIIRAHDPKTGQMWLGVAGLSGIGTLAAHQILLNPEEMAGLVGNLPGGWEKKDLEMILEIQVVQGSPGTSKLVAYSIW